MLNNELREYAKSKKVRFWQIAKKLNVSEAYITRMLRNELDENALSKLMGLIDEISIENKQTD